jgi:hypothetical protein
MKSLDAFAASIKVYAPGCADPTMYFGIRQAAIEFCERTRLWRFDDEFQVSFDDAEGISAPYGAEIHEMEAVSFNGQPLEPKTTSWLDEHMRGWRTAGQVTGVPNYFTQTEPDTIRLVPFMAGTLGLHLWLKPTQDADQLPDWMVDQHRETIAHGALARILLIPNQSFTNPEMGMVFANAFQSKLDGLSNKGFTGQQRAPVRSKATYF